MVAPSSLSTFPKAHLYLLNQAPEVGLGYLDSDSTKIQPRIFSNNTPLFQLQQTMMDRFCHLWFFMSNPVLILLYKGTNADMREFSNYFTRIETNGTFQALSKCRNLADPIAFLVALSDSHIDYIMNNAR